MRKTSLAGFTLVELMVSTAIIALIMAILLQMTGQTANTWRLGSARVEQFSEARKAFETMTRRLSDATLNTYWDYYYNPNNPDIPAGYTRQSELRFRVVQMKDLTTANYTRTGLGVFFQGPFGTVEDNENMGQMNDLLNNWGYFVEISDTNATGRPKFLKDETQKRYRSRLMEFRQSSEQFKLYKMRQDAMGPQQDRSPDPLIDGSGRVTPNDDKWFTDDIDLGIAANPPRPVRALAENVIALIILPRLSPGDEARRKKDGARNLVLSPNYTYHSKQNNNYGEVALPAKEKPGELNPKNQLPPLLQVAMVAIDEASAEQLSRLSALNDPTTLGLDTMMQGLFEDSTRLEQGTGAQPGDLARLEEILLQKRLSYRIFTSTVALRGAKWSTVSPN